MFVDWTARLLLGLFESAITAANICLKLSTLVQSELKSEVIASVLVLAAAVVAV